MSYSYTKCTRSTRRNLSADVITYAIKCRLSNVCLNGETNYNFYNIHDKNHCIDIIKNQIRLIELNMADTNRMYKMPDYKTALTFLINIGK